MFSATDYHKLYQIMDESPEKKELLTRLLDSHRVEVSTLSHEIRNPLTLVYSYLQLIEAKHPEVSTFQYWSHLHQDIEYMKCLLEELSVYNNSDKLHYTEIDTTSFFRMAALSFASTLVDTDIQFISNIESSLPVICCDSIKLRQVLTNLFVNAKEASGHSHPVIHFSVYAKDHSLIITISDNGCGIEKECLSTIFEPFVTYKKNGTGLGLAIISRIVHAHHGTIEVSSTPGVLTTFTLTLPI